MGGAQRGRAWQSFVASSPQTLRLTYILRGGW
jgi:hypothetical protein